MLLDFNNNELLEQKNHDESIPRNGQDLWKFPIVFSIPFHMHIPLTFHSTSILHFFLHENLKAKF